MKTTLAKNFPVFLKKAPAKNFSRLRCKQWGQPLYNVSRLCCGQSGRCFKIAVCAVAAFTEQKGEQPIGCSPF
ncbi:hypothetical protein [Anaerotruncus sp.]|uniref:hypothetical protein n=1 Tax=Anaerotruncus sp. TaxID=1872531 RepID=UPI0025C4A557|nr:hypothetical protein [Anaerotruncus sp.]